MLQGVRCGSLAIGRWRPWKAHKPRELVPDAATAAEGWGGAELMPPPAVLEDAPEWALVWRALRELSGFDRGVRYNVPRWAAPRPLQRGSIYLHGSVEWRRYLAARRRVDDGELKPVLALRPLSDAERLLVGQLPRSLPY